MRGFSGKPSHDRSPRRHRRSRLRRAFGRESAGRKAVRRHGDRPAQLSPVPAAALSGRDRKPVACRDRLSDPRHPAARAERQRDARQGVRHRHGEPRGARRRPPHSLRHAGSRDRRAARLFRPRRVGGVRARAEDHRRCDLHPPPHPARLREGRERDRSGRARAAVELRHRRRRPDRRRDGGRDRGACQPRARRGLPRDRSARGAHHSGRSRAAPAHAVRSATVRSREAIARTARRRGAAWRRP